MFGKNKIWTWLYRLMVMGIQIITWLFQADYFGKTVITFFRNEPKDALTKLEKMITPVYKMITARKKLNFCQEKCQKCLYKSKNSISHYVKNIITFHWN